MHELITRLVSTAHPYLRMRSSATYRDWAVALRTLAGAPELAVLRPVLEGLADNRLSTLAPMNDFLQGDGTSLPLEALWNASPRIEQAVAENSHAALVAATVFLQAWSVRLDTALYRQDGGMPEPGWARHPYVCALAALKAGAVDESLRLIETSLDVLNAARYREHPRFQHAIARYRTLGRDAETRWRSALDDLAFDLQQSCRREQPNFRAEMGALLWTLGLIPESSSFRPDAPETGLPALRLCRQVVQQSLLGIAFDPLCQYIWLGMKDRKPFNTRDHPVFYGTFDLTYRNHLLDDALPEPPSRLFALALVGWFRGDLPRTLASKYMGVFELVETEFPEVDWSIYIRMSHFASMLAERFGWMTQDVATQKAELLADLVGKSTSVNRNRFLHPEWPEIFARTTGPVFAELEHLPPGPDASARRMAALEGFRAGGMKYWLTVAVPRPSPREASDAAALLDEERILIDDLKGAYFLLLTRILPMHYRRADSVLEPDDLRSLRYPDVKEGPVQYKRVMEGLDALGERLQHVAPRYAAGRGTSAIDVHALADALGRHRSPLP